MVSPRSNRLSRVIGATLMVAIAACSADASDEPEASRSTLAAAAEPCDSAGDAIYFGQSGQSGRVVKDDAGTRLTLDGVAATSWFTDRPGRDAGVVATSAFTAMFGESGVDRPVVAMISTVDDSGTDNRVVLVDDPVWDASDATIEYRVGSMVAGDDAPLAAGAIGPVSIVIDSDSLATSCESPASEAMVFAQSGASASIDRSADRTTLRIGQPGPTLFFAGGSQRIGGAIDPARFIEDWNSASGFRADPPNGFLVDLDATGSDAALISVELSDPELVDGELRYEIAALDGDTLESMPERMEHFVLFIDDASPDEATAVSSQAAIASQDAVQQAIADAQASMRTSLAAANDALASAGANDALTSPEQALLAAQQSLSPDANVAAALQQSTAAQQQAVATAQAQVNAAMNATVDAGTSISSPGS
jgi:hypothetical protein